MYSGQELRSTSKKKVLITAEYFVQEDTTDILVVMFSGKGYGYEWPLLYYATNVALECGCDVLYMPYYFVQSGVPFVYEDAGDIEAVVADCGEMLQKCLEHKAYTKTVFLSKSIGGVFAELVEKQIDNPDIEIQHFVLTPVEQSVLFVCRNQSIVVFGDADTFTSAAAKAQMRGADLPTVYEMPEANHSLQVDGDYKKSLAILGRVMDIWHQFLQNTKSAK